MKKMMELGIAFLMLVAMACENGGQENEANDGLPSPEDLEEVDSALLLAEVDLGEINVKFLQRDRDDLGTLELQEESSAYISESPLDSLALQNLTFLEIFMAIAPEQEPPQALIDSHAAQAKSLNREDDSVREVEIDVAATTVKSTTVCDSVAFQDPEFWTRVGYRRSKNYIQGWDYLGVWDFNFMNHGEVTMTWCNESSTDLLYAYYDSTEQNQNWVCHSLGSIPAYKQKRFFKIVPTNYSNGSRYFAAGNGVYHHIRTGVVLDKVM